MLKTKYLTLLLIPLLVLSLCAIDTSLNDYTVDIRWTWLRLVTILGLITLELKC